MYTLIKFDNIADEANRYTFVDLRSPSEFADGHISGAFSLPLFTDVERAAVGTVYKEKGQLQATRLGLEYVAQSLPGMYDRFTELYKERQRGGQIVLYCARGGMRSESVASFFSSLGFHVCKLEDGYKGYRRHIADMLPKLIDSFEYVTLFGKTGSGKTRILHEMNALGYGVLDLEGLANHRGSLLGAVGLFEKRTQKQFESLLYDRLMALKQLGYTQIFTEGESRRIGGVYLPNELMDKMHNGRKARIEADIEFRKEVIRADYIAEPFDRDGAVSALEKLSKYISVERIREYIKMLDAGDFDTIIEELMVKYYDIVYKEAGLAFEKTFHHEDTSKSALEIAEYFE